MSENRTIVIAGIGPVLYERSRRARRTGITVTLSRGVRVAVPFTVSFERAQEFVLAKKEWIVSHLEKLRQYEEACRGRVDQTAAIDRRQARQLLTRRVRQLARQHGFRFGRISIRQQRTRWGSCSVKNNLSLNQKLAALPDELIDYVVLHELVHTRIKNHGHSFWKALDEVVGDARRKRAKLRGYRLD